MKEKKSDLVTDMSSEAYHSAPNSFSSSQLKTMLEDPEIFYRRYITKEIERETMSAFDVGTYFHTAILEPEKLNLECAVFGGIRRGKEWEAFKVANVAKTIITQSELDQAETLIKAVKSSDLAMKYLKQGKPEVSAFLDMYIYEGNIYSKGYRLSLVGWMKDPEGYQLAAKKGIHLVFKVRADLLGDKGFILDLKSTTGNIKNEFNMRATISKYSYDLSAALYLDLFTLATGRYYHTFIWTFASKDYGTCKNYVASDKNIKVGRAKYMKAILTLADYIASEWKFNESLTVLEPQFFEQEWLAEKKEEGVDL